MARMLHRTIHNHMADNPTAPFCSRCGEEIGGIPTGIEAAVCGLCTMVLAQVYGKEPSGKNTDEQKATDGLKGARHANC